MKLMILCLCLLSGCTAGKVVILGEDTATVADTGPSCTPTAEVCNGLDDDCDGLIDQGLQQIAYLDEDDDGYGYDALNTTCVLPAGTSWTGGDCNDADASVNPAAPEIWYDGLDSNCAGDNDFDRDLDGHEYDVDCNDQDPSIHPGATEQCGDQEDEDCDGVLDEDWEVGATCITDDNDGDGYGAASDDCDDTSDVINPAAPENCNNGLDDDCDGAADTFGDTDCE